MMTADSELEMAAEWIFDGKPAEGRSFQKLFPEETPLADTRESEGGSSFEKFDLTNLSIFPQFDERPQLVNADNAQMVCVVTSSGLECRVCGASDGKTSGSTIGVLLCMAIIVLWTAVGRRQTGSRKSAKILESA